MKKRILGLALALIMIISLLPLTTFAAAPTKVKVVLYNSGQGHATEPRIDCETQNQTNYIYVEDPTATAHKANYTTTEKTDNYVKITYANGVYTMVFKNFNYTNLNDGGSVFYVNTSGEYDINVILEGTNTINAKSTALQFNNTGKVTISGDGSLTITNTKASADSIYKNGAGELEIKDVTINVAMGEGVGLRHCITANGDVTIDGATLDLTAPGGSGIRTASERTSGAVAKNVTIKNNANVKITQPASQSALIANKAGDVSGVVTIDNSTVELIGNANNAKVLLAAPTVTGTYSSQIYSVWNPGGGTYVEKNYTAAAFDSNVRYLKFVHEHKATADDGDCTTASVCGCGYEMAPAAAAHVAGTKTDCTKNTPCGNENCTKDFAQDALAAHVPGEDDGNCLTPVKCANCDQPAVAAAEAHTGGTATCTAKAKCEKCGTEYGEMLPHTGGTATCTAKAKCAVCTQEYGELAAHTPKDGEYACNENHPCANPDCTVPYRPAGTHVGGGTEATCEKKAVCKCGEEYGELAACKPAADDDDCTTDIKCSVCGKVTTKGEAAHKYTDKKDTTCDNEGCKHTRKVEDDTTENPKTGDNTVLVLALSLMAASAAAFVCTKKFAR